MKRRHFLHTLGWTTGIASGGWRSLRRLISDPHKSSAPLVISTWRVIKSNEEAWRTLQNDGSALDAVVNGVAVEEADPKGQSVGIGGLPDREGQVTLDACVMNHKGEAGSVVYVRGFKHVAALARKVMEETPHVILAGAGAEQFAREQGFEEEDLLTENSKAAWKKWLEKKQYEPVINIENHDTIGMLAIDKKGELSGACSTSGLAYKMNGRVGDSPIIGAGLFVDNEFGAATATGLGESILKISGCAIIVELMRHGYTPQEACEEAVKRITRQEDNKDFQACFIAVNKQGDTGAFALQPGFIYTITREGKTEILPAGSWYER